jgi:hypothetical protein
MSAAPPAPANATPLLPGRCWYRQDERNLKPPVPFEQ